MMAIHNGSVIVNNDADKYGCWPAGFKIVDGVPYRPPFAGSLFAATVIAKNEKDKEKARAMTEILQNYLLFTASEPYRFIVEGMYTDHPTIKKREPFGSLAASKEYHDQKMQVESMQMNKRIESHQRPAHAMRSWLDDRMENEIAKDKKNSDWTEVSDRVFHKEKRVDLSKDIAFLEGESYDKPVNVTTKNKGIKNMFKRKADRPVEMNEVATRDQVKAWILLSYGVSCPMEIKVDHYDELVVREPNGAKLKTAEEYNKLMRDSAVQTQMTATAHTAAMIKLQEKVDTLKHRLEEHKEMSAVEYDALRMKCNDFKNKLENVTEEAKRWKKLNLESTIERDMTKDLLEKEISQRISNFAAASTVATMASKSKKSK